MEVPRLNFQRVDVQIPNVDFPRLRDRFRPIPHIPSSRTAMGELVATTCRQLEIDVSAGQPRRISRKLVSGRLY